MGKKNVSPDSLTKTIGKIKLLIIEEREKNVNLSPEDTLELPAIENGDGRIYWNIRNKNASTPILGFGLLD